MDDANNANPIAEEQPQVSPTEQNQSVEQSPEPEATEWNKLGGGTKERVRDLIRQRNEARAAAEAAKAQVVPPPPPQEYVPANQVAPGQLTPEQELAIENLRKFGVWTKKDQEEFEKRQQEQLTMTKREVEDNVLIESEYTRLESTHNGSDGLPAFDRAVIEEHMKATGIYNPEKAYEDLYRDELFDSWAKGRGSKKAETFTEKPRSVTATTEPLTMDGLRERLRQPDGVAWWEKNRERLLPLVGELMK